MPEHPTAADAYASEAEGLRLQIPGVPIHLYGGSMDCCFDDWCADAGELLFVVMTPAQARLIGIAIANDADGRYAERLREAGYDLPLAPIAPAPAPGSGSGGAR